MSNVFDFKRFGKYFGYSLRNAWNNFSLSLLICALTPVLVFVFYELICLMFDGHFRASSEWLRDFAAALGFLLVVLIAPAKLFGCITDGRTGTGFLMIPASTFEKWLSIMLICALVLPLCLGVLMLAGDTLMELVFGSGYAGVYMFTILRDSFSIEIDGGFTVNAFAIGYVGWITSILSYTLGALVFKKAKVGKTLLCLMLLGIIFGFLVVSASCNMAFGSQEWQSIEDDPIAVVSRINLLHNLIYLVYACVLAGAVYLRLKTITH